MYLFYFGIHFIGPWTQMLSGFVLDFKFVWRFEIYVSTSPKMIVT